VCNGKTIHAERFLLWIPNFARGRWAFARLVSVGIAVEIGSLLEVMMGSVTAHEGVLHWAIGCTILALGGVAYLTTHKSWESEE
jgi:hypothetical protein